jgi:F0F1-type ATP synthase delta subunit
VKSEPGVQLIDGIMTPIELGKIMREVYSIDEFLSAKSHGIQSGLSLPALSPSLQAILNAQKINLLLPDHRARFKQQLDFVRRTAPVVQVSFGAEPSRQALRVLVRWFRENGHPNTLIAIGIQPRIAGGCIVRTSTKTFDFSLQKLLKSNQTVLAILIK